MKCNRYKDLLEEWLDGALPQEESAALERHVVRCPACARLLARRSAMGQALEQSFRQWNAGLHFQPRPQSGIRVGKRLTWRQQWLRFHPGTIMALAAVALVTLLFLFQPWTRLRQRSAAGKLPIAVITVRDSLNIADESFISGRSNGYSYRIHLEVSIARVNDRS
jgi:anti-sigma factor RsiW